MSVDTGTAPQQGAVSAPARGRMFTALRSRNYRIFLAGAFVSNVGTWMQRVAQDWLVLELSGGSALAVGVTTGLQFLPMLLSPYGGLIADRFDKRRILKITQFWLALCALALGLLAVTGLASTEHVYVLALLFGIGVAFDNPARQTFVAEIAGPQHLPNAIGLNSASFHAARIVGPALAGLVIAAFGSGWAILSNFVTYAAFIAALLLLDASRLDIVEPAARAKRQIREGLAYVRRHDRILLVLCVAFFIGTFGMNFQMTSALMASQEFGLGPQAYGILGTFVAVGSLAGALLAARRRAAPSAALRGDDGLHVRGGRGRGRSDADLRLVRGGASCAGAGHVADPDRGERLDPAGGGAAAARAGDGAVHHAAARRHLIGAPILGWVGEAFGPRWTLIGGGALLRWGFWSARR